MRTTHLLLVVVMGVACGRVHALIFFSFSDVPGLTTSYSAPADGETHGRLFVSGSTFTLAIDSADDGGSAVQVPATIQFDLRIGPRENLLPLTDSAPVDGSVTFRAAPGPGAACGDGDLLLRAEIVRGFLLIQGSTGSLSGLSGGVDDENDLLFLPGPAMASVDPIATSLGRPADLVVTLTEISFDGPRYVATEEGSFFADFASAGVAATATATPKACPGDVDLDGDTDVFDFAAMAAGFGSCVPSATAGDLDADGDVDVFDFAALAGDFGCGG
jgi:hypothetical protein